MTVKEMLDLVWIASARVLIVSGGYGQEELFKGLIVEVPYLYINQEVEWYTVFYRPSLDGAIDEDGEPKMEAYLTYCIKGGRVLKESVIGRDS